MCFLLAKEWVFEGLPENSSIISQWVTVEQSLVWDNVAIFYQERVMKAVSHGSCIYSFR